MVSWASFHIEKLKGGEIVKFRPKGNSMEPKIKSGQLVTVVPIPTTAQSTLSVGDIVLCTVSGKHHLHLISAIRGDQFQISNNQGWINGWTTAKQIYGKVVMIEP